MKNNIKKLILSVVLLYSTAFASSLLQPSPQLFEMNYDRDTTCVVRQLKVYKDPKWVSKIHLKNGKDLYFSSPKSMFEFYFHPGKWQQFHIKSEDDFRHLAVVDYMSLKAIDAKKAFFVYGSQAISPAGDDLAAFEKEIDAKNFLKKYHGSRIFKFHEVKDSLIRLLNNRI